MSASAVWSRNKIDSELRSVMKPRAVACHTVSVGRKLERMNKSVFAATAFAIALTHTPFVHATEPADAEAVSGPAADSGQSPAPEAATMPVPEQAPPPAECLLGVGGDRLARALYCGTRSPQVVNGSFQLVGTALGVAGIVMMSKAKRSRATTFHVAPGFDGRGLHFGVRF